KHGMSEKDIQFKNLTVPDAAAAFIAGKVDAAGVWQPWINQIQKEGKGTAVFTSKEIPGLIPDLLVFQEKGVTERAEDVQKKIADFLKAQDLMKTVPDFESALEPKFVKAMKK